MRTFVSLIAIAVIAYVLLGVLLYVMQERMVFLAGLPGRALEATPRDVGFEFDDVYLETADGVSLHGWYVHAQDPLGTVLFLHGNAGNISHRLDSIAIFHDLGFNVFIIDYRGYGRSTGTPSEEGLHRDAEAALDHVVRRRAVERNPDVDLDAPPSPNALDIVYYCSPRKAYQMALQLRREGFFRGGIGLYSTFIHLDTRGYAATWRRV